MADNKNQRDPTLVQQPPRRETKYQPAEPNAAGGSAVQPNPHDNRKIVGVLASYTWKAEGVLYPIYEGRTHIGAGQIKEDTLHRTVDVHCPLDRMLSEDHALILVQQKKFWIRDLDSMNGTFLNGTQLPPDAAQELPDHAEIKVGKTVFTFLKIEPKSPVVTETAPAVKVEIPAQPSERKTILK